MSPTSSGWPRLRGSLIVSCQAFPGEPLYGPAHMVAMARSAVLGGAAAVRANGPDDVAGIAGSVEVPVIGLFKDDLPGIDVRITPTLEHALAIASAGADVVAIDATGRTRGDGLTLAETIEAIHVRARKPVLADVATLAEGLAAAAAGADAISTTLSGYTADSPAADGPDLVLVGGLVRELRIPIIAEGRIATTDHVVGALRAGAAAVVIGAAITRPQWITSRLVEASRRWRP